MESPPSRKQFRFKTWRANRAANSLRVDEAIEAVGLALFPERWGLQPDFEELPLFWRKQKSGLFRLVPRKTTFDRVDVEAPTEAMTELADEYREVYRTLRRGLRSGVRAKAVTYGGYRYPLTSEVFTTQYVSIFGAGTVKLYQKRRRVWIHRVEFQKWFYKNILPEQRLSDFTRDLIIEHLTDAYTNNVIERLSRPQIFDFVVSWLKIRCAKRDIETIITNLPLGFRQGGRLNKTEWETKLVGLVESMNIRRLKR